MSKKKTKALAPAPAFDLKQLDEVVKWAVSGASEQNILEAIDETFPGSDGRQMLGAAMMQISKNADADPLVVMAWTFEAAKYCYQRMVDANDFAGALKALKYMNELAASMEATSRPEEETA